MSMMDLSDEMSRQAGYRQGYGEAMKRAIEAAREAGFYDFAHDLLQLPIPALPDPWSVAFDGPEEKKP